MGMTATEMAEIRLKVMGLTDLLDDLGKAKDGAGQLADGLNRSVPASATLSDNLRSMGVTMKSVAMSALESYGNLEKLAGVKGVGERIKDWEGWEEKLVDIRASLGVTKQELDKLVGTRGSILFEVATKSGLAPEKVADALVAVQNETSKGGAFMANGGAVMTAASKFAKATGADVKDTAVSMGTFADQFGLSEKDMLKIPGMLFMQQQQGSLEAKTMGKFTKAAAPYQGLTGKKGLEGFAEMFAVANLIKDKGGTGKGEQGAATASTLLMSMMASLADPKKLKGVEKALGGSVSKDGRVSMDLLMARLRAAGGNEDKETLDKAAKGDEGAALKLGNESKLFKDMARLIGNSQARRAFTALYASAKMDQGTDKDLKKLRAPDGEKGAGMIEDVTDEYGGTRKGIGQRRETQALRDTVRTYRKSGGIEVMDAAGAKANETIANNPTLAVLAETLSVGGFNPVKAAMTGFNAASLAGRAAGNALEVQQAPTINLTVNVAADGSGVKVVSEQRSVSQNANPPQGARKGVR